MSNMKEAWRLLVSSLFVFLLVFSFKLPFIYNSALLSLCLSMAFWALRHEVPLIDLRALIIILPYTILFFVVFIHVWISGTGDYSRLDSVLVNMAVFIIVFASLSCVSYSCRPDGNRLLDISNVIFMAFFIQSLIIIFSAMSPEVKSVVRYFQIPFDRDYSIKFGGIRGLALSGAQFFPLSAAFAMAQPLICYSIINSNRYRYIKMLGFISIAAAGITAGRTSLIGTLFALLFLFYAFVKYREIKKFSINMVMLLLVFGTVVYSLESNISSSFSSLFDLYLKFGFEFIYNLKEKGTLTTSSTDVLYSMYWTVEPYRFIFGYGEYKSQFGTPFMGTDGGYMRNILLFGLSGTFLVVLLNFFIFLLIYNQNKKIKDSAFLCLILWGLTSVLHIKGDILLHLVSVQTIIFIIFIYTYYETGYKKHSIS